MIDDYLGQKIGQAAAHEDAAGDFGERVSGYLEGHADGEDVIQMLPSPDDRAHHGLYEQMALDMDVELDSVKPDDTVYDKAVDAIASIDDPDARVEAAAAGGYAMEQMAYDAAADVEEAAEAAGRTEFLNDARQIKRDEGSEAAEFKRYLRQNCGWTEVKFSAIDTVDDFVDFRLL